VLVKQYFPQKQRRGGQWTPCNRYLSANAVLSVCALILIIASCCFITFQLRCFEGKKDTIVEEVEVPVWKKMAYRDNKCNICDQYGS